jgi:hypothetical protein
VAAIEGRPLVIHTGKRSEPEIPEEFNHQTMLIIYPNPFNGLQLKAYMIQTTINTCHLYKEQDMVVLIRILCTNLLAR